MNRSSDIEYENIEVGAERGRIVNELWLKFKALIKAGDTEKAEEVRSDIADIKH